MTERVDRPASNVYQFVAGASSCLRLTKSLHKSIAKWHRAHLIQLEPEYFKFREWCGILGVQEIDQVITNDPGGPAITQFENRLRRHLRFDNDRMGGIIIGYVSSLSSDLRLASEAPFPPAAQPEIHRHSYPAARGTSKSLSRLFRKSETVPEPVSTTTTKPGRVTVGDKWQTVGKQAFLVLLDTLTKVNAALVAFLAEEDKARVSQRVQGSVLRSLNLQVKAIGDSLPQEREMQTLAALRDELRRERQQPSSDVMGKYVASAIPPVKVIDVTDFDHLLESGEAREVASLGGTEVFVEWSGYKDQERLDKLVGQGNLVGLLSVAGLWQKFGTLPLNGVTIDRERMRVGLVFGSPERSAEPSTLLEVLAKGCPLPLGRRFRMATELAASVHQLLSVGWLDKVLDCESLVCFETPPKRESTGAQSWLNEPGAVKVCLTGWCSPRPGPQTESDVIYSFGLILLQLGLWKSLTILQEGSTSDEAFREKIKGQLCDSLLHTMGEIYWRATKRCLNTEFDRSADQGVTGEKSPARKGREIPILVAFDKQVLSELERCVA
ncbi:hypothetical protein QBC44DRAFT_322957 [Cladorrhinum sp. PSN332]|nr:hypothetical protein QBC44DRAFT_322957 [Cladorrhinum sp. PSN332]